MAGAALSHDDANGVLADRERAFATKLNSWPELADIMAGAQRVGPIRVVDRWHGYFREAAGPGWALLGDAGHFKDPTPGQGIADAMRHAFALADAIEAGLSDDSLDARLSDWWAWRDADAREMHWFATDLGAAGPVLPLVNQVLRDIAADQSDTMRLFGVLNHDIKPSEMFTNGRLARAGGRILRHRPSQVGAMVREVRGVLKAESYRRRRTTDRPPTR
jgi:2-polyprenyl-6-methoxyphenol hydroxylase-like FAD-dependent oxidoreductase